MDEQTLDAVAERLFALPTVQAVALGGSRAAGLHRSDSDWDLAIYYRGSFDPEALRQLGWSGQVFEIGAWGGGVFNGGAWLEIDHSKVDVHYRDLHSIEHEIAEAAAGRFRVEPLLFHLAGIPTYLLLAELACNRVLRGELPRPSYPAALRRSAPPRWWDMATLSLEYARDNHARAGRLTQCVGLLAQGASQAAHAVLAARGEWITNEKHLLYRADLRDVDRLMTSADADPDTLAHLTDEVRALCQETVRSATART